jgi:FixJ family two-component response regulator
VNAVIAVVDDDAAVLRALTRLLEGAGYTVQTFGSPEAFLAREDLESIDCLLLDIRMNGMSGLDLQERLAQDQIPIPIIFITAYDDAPTRERARKGGAVAYFAKPFEGHLLIEAIEKALGGQ